MNIVLTIVIACLTLFSMPVNAYVGVPVLVTTSPMAGEEIFLEVDVRQCDLVSGEYPSSHSVEGDVIKVTFTTREFTSCNFPSYTYRFSAGSHPQGNYTLEAYKIRIPALSVGPPAVPALAAVFPVTVQGAPYVFTPVPAWSPWQLVVLALVLIAAALTAGASTFQRRFRTRAR